MGNNKIYHISIGVFFANMVFSRFKNEKDLLTDFKN